ncbi:helix-turn-helix domain-containing protein [Dactylosporangium cerinum]|uniref:Helix-turn-helix domain-containing protein n=1 Tax=Dactylosporangium cerinum TaxID=1434730 RepID=A0ABV9WEE8_9ACTN
MSSTVHQARESLGHQLRDIRKDAGLTGRQLAQAAGWYPSKVSKIEYGRQTPSEDDIRHWCRECGAADQIDGLIAAVRHIESMYVEWRRTLRAGTKRRQEASIALEAETKLFRWFEPVIMPGLVQTAEYAAAMLSALVDFWQIPNDVTAGVAARMERQQILYRGVHRFHFIVAEQALYTIVGDPAVMAGQLDRVLTIMSVPRVHLGIVPARHAYTAPTHAFCMLDDRVVLVETISAELTVTQPREVALYSHAFEALTRSAKYGNAAKSIIADALGTYR